MSLTPVDIEGLNLVLGGGVPILKRVPGPAGESATLVVRGPPGSGKTILGTQLAGALGRALGCDVAYGCVELLPSELAAQHGTIKRSDVSERVVPAPFAKDEPKSEQCRIFAGLLDIDPSAEEGPNISRSVGDLLEAIKEAGGKPRIVVIDSLSEGYGLGASAPRRLADDLCKMAALQGLILILLEESIGLSPSVWSFACDTVFELGASEDDHAPGMPSLFMRRLVVSKNRLGPSDPGPHRFNLLPGEGVRILPRPTSYLLPWAKEVALTLPRAGVPFLPSWGTTDLDNGLPSFAQCITSIHGADARDVFDVAKRIGAAQHSAFMDLFVDFNAQAFGELQKLREGPTWSTVSLGNPFVNSNQIIADTLVKLRELHGPNRRSVGRVLIGDLQALRSFWDPAGCRHAVSILVALLRQMNISGVLFETTAPRTTRELAPMTGSVIERGTEVTTPSSVDFADVVLEIQSEVDRRSGAVLRITATHVRRGRLLETRLPRS
jgi:KaiC/GvpD/RAD55 family RecA-like ATPase